MPISDESRRGRERQEIGVHALDTALKEWEKASQEEKPKHAFAILSQVGAIGSKLEDLITDPQKVSAIRADAQRLHK